MTLRNPRKFREAPPEKKNKGRRISMEFLSLPTYQWRKLPTDSHGENFSFFGQKGKIFTSPSTVGCRENRINSETEAP